jgi:hypothetical protein
MSSNKRAMAHNTVPKSQPIAGFIILFASTSILFASPSCVRHSGVIEREDGGQSA